MKTIAKETETFITVSGSSLDHDPWFIKDNSNKRRSF